MTAQDSRLDLLEPTMRWLPQAFLVSVIVVLAFAGVSIIQYLLISTGVWQPSAEHAQSGDMFGLANAISSALAFALLIVTLRLQSMELREQREQFQKMANAQTASDEKMLLQTYLNALSLEATYECEKPINCTNYSDALEAALLSLRFGRRAQWVRRKVEAELNGTAHPASLNGEQYETAEANLKYWRILARFLDQADYSPTATTEFCRKFAPLTETAYWHSLPQNSAKLALGPLVELCRNTVTCRTHEEDPKLYVNIESAIQPIRELFIPIVKTLCTPAPR